MVGILREKIARLLSGFAGVSEKEKALWEARENLPEPLKPFSDILCPKGKLPRIIQWFNKKKLPKDVSQICCMCGGQFRGFLTKTASDVLNKAPASKKQAIGELLALFQKLFPGRALPIFCNECAQKFSRKDAG